MIDYLIGCVVYWSKTLFTMVLKSNYVLCECIMRLCAATPPHEVRKALFTMLLEVGVHFDTLFTIHF